MPLREGEPQVRKHIWLFEADVAEVKALFGQTLGESKAIRLMVRKCLTQLRAKAEERRRAASPNFKAEIEAMLNEEEKTDVGAK